MDQDSIAIQVTKLLEWLINRRICKNESQPEIVKIRAKINAAIQDMPAHKTITSLLSGTYINYFHCLKIVEILETTEADTKNIFGRYSSKRMKDWQEIVNLYKKNNVYLAEAADLLISTVKYDVPNMKKLISKQEQLQNDAKKKESDAVKSSNSARNDLKLFLKELGLESEGSFRKRLIENARHLGSTHEAVVTATREILPALEHYTNFAAISVPQQTVQLNLITYIAEKGNTTVYEMLNGEPPSQIRLPPPVFVEDEPEVDGDVIDWGNDGITALDSEEKMDEIDWGTEGGTEPESTEAEDSKEVVTGTVASGDKALTILDNIATRNNFVNQLLELRSFLNMRIMEAQKEGPIDDLVESVDILNGMHKTVDNVVTLLLSKNSQHLFNILHQPKYLDTILSKIQEKQDSIERWVAISKLSRERAAEAALEAVSLTNKTKTLVKKARELQEEIKNDISSRYNGMHVLLMGGPAF